MDTFFDFLLFSGSIALFALGINKNMDNLTIAGVIIFVF
jgi:hypothetical protein